MTKMSPIKRKKNMNLSNSSTSKENNKNKTNYHACWENTSFSNEKQALLGSADLINTEMSAVHSFTLMANN